MTIEEKGGSRATPGRSVVAREVLTARVSRTAFMRERTRVQPSAHAQDDGSSSAESRGSPDGSSSRDDIQRS